MCKSRATSIIARKAVMMKKPRIQLRLLLPESVQVIKYPTYPIAHRQARIRRIEVKMRTDMQIRNAVCFFVVPLASEQKIAAKLRGNIKPVSRRHRSNAVITRIDFSSDKMNEGYYKIWVAQFGNAVILIGYCLEPRIAGVHFWVHPGWAVLLSTSSFQ